MKNVMFNDYEICQAMLFQQQPFKPFECNWNYNFAN